MASSTTEVESVLHKPEDVAAMLNISVRTLRRWVTEEEVPYRKIGRLTRFSDEDVEAIIRHAERPARVAVKPLRSARRSRR